MVYIQIPGYTIKFSSITGISDVKEIIEEEETKPKEGEEVLTPKKGYHIALFFDGSKIEWLFDNQGEPMALRRKIIDLMNVSNELK